jgi:hypothetical protein
MWESSLSIGSEIHPLNLGDAILFRISRAPQISKRWQAACGGLLVTTG